MNLPKAMVTSIYGHEDMIDYMSTYRTQDKMKGKHYIPRGGLFWFTCNQYGDLTGSCYFIKSVPDQELYATSYFGTYRKRKPKEVPTLPKVFTDDKTVEEHKQSSVKPRLYQKQIAIPYSKRPKTTEKQERK